MKLLFENWREYINEQINPDLGETFTTITFDNIIKNKYNNIEDKSVVLVLLNLFDQLNEEADLSKVKNKLKTMYIMSGNSNDFSFLKDYDNSENDIVTKKQIIKDFYSSSDYYHSFDTTEQGKADPYNKSFRRTSIAPKEE
jgi:hypothetical protein